MNEFAADCDASLAAVERCADAWDDGWTERAEAEAEDRALEDRYNVSPEYDDQERENVLDRLALIVDAFDKYVSSGPSGEVGALLTLAQAAKNAEEILRAARRDLENRIVEELPVGATVGDAEVIWSASTTQVDWDGLLPRIKAAIADERATHYDDAGELLPPDERVARSIDRFHQIVGFSQPKKPGLRSIGVDIDEFATVRGAPKIKWAKS